MDSLAVVLSTLLVVTQAEPTEQAFLVMPLAFTTALVVLSMILLYGLFIAQHPIE